MVALENHGDLARYQRGIYKEALKLYCNNLTAVSEVDKLKLSSVTNRLPDFINGCDIVDAEELSTVVHLLCQDLRGIFCYHPIRRQDPVSTTTLLNFTCILL